MTPPNWRIAALLTHAGILPPWLLLAVHVLMPLEGLHLAALTYGAIITSFVCGMDWGMFTRSDERMTVNLLVTSNVGALLAWAAVLLSAWWVPAAFIGLALILGALLALDWRLLKSGNTEPWFWAIRRNATIGLGASLLLWAVLA
jgi:hypothetical protein